jgi:tripartite-type tricarboxylate transporter receptor subunit TctC
MCARFSGRRQLASGLMVLLLSIMGAPMNVGAQKVQSGLAFRVVVPTGPGPSPDVISRLVAADVSDAAGWRIIVENRPGALQTIAMADVLKQPADGLSIFQMSTGAIAVPALLPQKNIKFETDFAPVIKIASGYLVLVAHPSVPATTIRELIALTKNQPNKFNFSSGGFGTPAHLAAELFMLQTGARATHVPYPQPQQRVADLLSGATQFAFFNTPAVIGYIATGKLRAIAVTAPKRVAALKDVPTVGEQGFPNLVVADWQGFVVKKGSPHDVIALLNGAVNRTLNKPKIQESLARIGYEPSGGTPDEFGAFIRSESAVWAKVVAESGIKVPQ